MKRKTETRKVVVRNTGFIATVRRSAAERTERQARISEEMRASGIVDTLIEVNQKIAKNQAVAVKK
jgi:hypothetical protein